MTMKQRAAIHILVRAKAHLGKHFTGSTFNEQETLHDALDVLENALIELLTIGQFGKSGDFATDTVRTS